MDDIDVNIKRNKRKLEKIRDNRQDRQQPRDNSTSTIGLFQATAGQDERDPFGFEGSERITYTGNSGMENIASTPRRFDSGVRSPFTENEYSAQGSNRDDGQARTPTLTVEDAETKAERERELGRQRQQRYRDNKKEAAQPQAQNRDSDVTGVTGIGNGKFSFNLKKNNAEPVKLLTKTEAEDAREALIYVYRKGSSLLDDVIEIMTAGHEPVTIWGMDEDEASIFAEAHLKKAQKDKGAARSARLLLRIHDKLFLTQYVASRAIATNRHIKSSGGISFK